MRRALPVFLGLLWLMAAPSAEAAEAPAGKGAPVAEEARPGVPMDQLLKRVKATAAAEREQDRKRESEFVRARDQQREQLQRTEALVKREEQQSTFLDQSYGENELELEALGTRLTERMGQMGELFGVVRLVATDMGAQAWDSLTSAGTGSRSDLLERLGRSNDLPSTEDLERLWFELQRELTEQSRVVRMTVPVLSADGESESERQVVRVGPFTAISEGHYLRWMPDQQKLRELERPLPPVYKRTAEAFWAHGTGLERLAVDPSRGVLLEALTETPSVRERIAQGGWVGYTIIALGVFAVLLGGTRLVVLTLTARRVDAQEERDRPADDNPLGRLLGVYEAHRGADAEALELKLDEAVLRENSRVQRYLWIVQTVSIVAPLLGLLGTVTGMIKTFQAITLYGAGDPKIMAGGISEALVTTMLGLIIAIPLVMLYALLATRSRRITDVLDERSSALLAARIEAGVAR
jgi:biopolymer transport protein ExbB